MKFEISEIKKCNGGLVGTMYNCVWTWVHEGSDGKIYGEQHRGAIFFKDSKGEVCFSLPKLRFPSKKPGKMNYRACGRITDDTHDLMVRMFREQFPKEYEQIGEGAVFEIEEREREEKKRDTLPGKGEVEV